MPIALVLDASAALEFSKDSIHVGEPISLLFEDPGRTFAVPITCMADAAVSAKDMDMLALLGHHPLGEVSSIDGAGWSELTEMSRALGSPGYAIPYLAAEEHNAYLLTAHPDRYPDVDRVIDIRH